MSVSSIFAMGGDCDYGYGYHKGGYKGYGGYKGHGGYGGYKGYGHYQSYYKGYYRNYYYGNRGLLGILG